MRASLISEARVACLHIPLAGKRWWEREGPAAESIEMSLWALGGRRVDSSSGSLISQVVPLRRGAGRAAVSRSLQTSPQHSTITPERRTQGKAFTEQKPHPD